MSEVVHIAGESVFIKKSTVGELVRQLCAWCGHVLIDYDTGLMAVPAGQEGPPATWPVGALVAVDGNASWTYDVRLPDEALPEASCTRAATATDPARWTRARTARATRRPSAASACATSRRVRGDLVKIVEHGILMSDGGFHVRPNDPELERVLPLADWIAMGQRHGGQVFTRTVEVVEGWRKVPRRTGRPGLLGQARIDAVADAALLYRKGLSVSAVSDRLGVPRTTVRAFLAEAGVATRRVVPRRCPDCGCCTDNACLKNKCDGECPCRIEVIR